MVHVLAAGLGFEPRYWDPKSHVLPLDDPALKKDIPQEEGYLVWAARGSNPEPSP